MASTSRDLRRVRFLGIIAAAALLAAVRPATAREATDAPAGLRVFYTGHSFHMFVPPRITPM